MKRRIVFIGPPASGKGTKARWLSEKEGIPYVSTGEIFREAMAADTPLGRLAKQFIDKGQLVPDDAVLKVVEDWIAVNASREGYIFDGVPRTLTQAQLLDARLAELKKPIELVLWLEPSVEMILCRIEGRRVCARCGANYHLTRLPPKLEGKCDRCGGSLAQRPDDTREMALRRLEVYRAQTQGLHD